MGELPEVTDRTILPSATGGDAASAREPRVGRWIAVGALCGLTWATGFRAYMAEIARFASEFDWVGTFAAILLPGLLVGAVLGWAAAELTAGRSRGVRWVRLAPITLAIAPLAMPGALDILLTQGLGAGGIAIALLAIGGGFALGQIGPLWARIVVGVIAIAIAAGTVATVPTVGGRMLALTEPRGAWVALLVACFLAVLALGSSIAWRRPRGHRRG